MATAADIARAAALLGAGGLVAFPTETVYGLGADAANAAAVARVYAVKGRPGDHPCIVHLARAAQIDAWAIDIPAAARLLSGRFWPGPLTLVLRRAPHVLDAVTGGQDTVALRVPAHPVAQALLAAFGGGVVGPSANRFGRVSPTTAAHVRDELGEAVDCVLEGGASDVGIESTVVDLSGPRPRLLRPGGIDAARIEAVLDEPLVRGATDAPRAPGMLESHYAPGTPVMTVRDDLVVELARTLAEGGQRVAVLAIGRPAPLSSNIVWRSLATDPAGYAQALYGALRELDRAGCDVIVAELPPDAPGWEAVRDRLRRASTNRADPG